ncbi:MAG: DUF2807 domain-containing protein [Bacteroidales bacterium]|nr:DUF2807 domain-containing protein [Bacteroidales bacterium]
MKKRIASLALMCALSLTAFAQNLIQETRNVNAFTGISASSAFNIELKKGPAQSVVIECDQRDMQYIKTEIRNGVLRLYYSSPARISRTKTSFKAYITITELDFLDLSGACSFTAHDLFTPKRFKADISGASKVNGLRLHTEDADIETSGAGSTTMEINANRTSIKASGSSRHNINGSMNQVNMEVSGASRIQANIKSDRIRLEASGASNITFEGEATQAKVSLSGASSLTAQKMIVKEMEVSASGASKANVHVTESLSPSLSSSSRLVYEGSPQINNIKISSGATINRR